MIGIYKITNLINGKIYVGQAQDIEMRWEQHINSAKRGERQVIYHAMRKYGIDNFAFEVLEQCSLDKLEEREIHYIETLNTYLHAENSNGYNMTLGGGGIRGHKHTEETKRKIGESEKGEKNHLYGKRLSFEHRRKISESEKGKIISEEHRKRISESNRGKTLSEETKQKISESSKGVAKTEEHKERISQAKKGKHKGANNSNSKKVMCENKEFSCVRECAEYYAINYGTMKSWLQGKCRTRQEFIDKNLHYLEENKEDK